MECTHAFYNPDCAHCQDVYNYCAYAEKEGYADFIDYFIVSKKKGTFELTIAGWEAMKAYYDRFSDIDAPENEEIEDDFDNSEVSDNFKLYA